MVNVSYSAYYASILPIDYTHSLIGSGCSDIAWLAPARLLVLPRPVSSDDEYRALEIMSGFVFVCGTQVRYFEIILLFLLNRIAGWFVPLEEC